MYIRCYARTLIRMSRSLEAYPINDNRATKVALTLVTLLSLIMGIRPSTRLGHLHSICMIGEDQTRPVGEYTYLSATE